MSAMKYLLMFCCKGRTGQTRPFTGLSIAATVTCVGFVSLAASRVSTRTVPYTAAAAAHEDTMLLMKEAVTEETPWCQLLLCVCVNDHVDWYRTHEPRQSNALALCLCLSHALPLTVSHIFYAACQCGYLETMCWRKKQSKSSSKFVVEKWWRFIGVPGHGGPTDTEWICEVKTQRGLANKINMKAWGVFGVGKQLRVTPTTLWSVRVCDKHMA